MRHRQTNSFLRCSLSCLMARPVSIYVELRAWSDMSCLHWKTALLQRGLPPGLMGFVSLWIADGTGGFESVPAPSGALSLFVGKRPEIWQNDEAQNNDQKGPEVGSLISKFIILPIRRLFDRAYQASGLFAVGGSGVGSLSPTGAAGRTMTPTGMEAFSMFRSWLTVTN